jgi:hypothetical protein
MSRTRTGVSAALDPEVFTKFIVGGIPRRSSYFSYSCRINRRLERGKVEHERAEAQVAPVGRVRKPRRCLRECFRKNGERLSSAPALPFSCAASFSNP